MKLNQFCFISEWKHCENLITFWAFSPLRVPRWRIQETILACCQQQIFQTQSGLWWLMVNTFFKFFYLVIVDSTTLNWFFYPAGPTLQCFWNSVLLIKLVCGLGCQLFLDCAKKFLEAGFTPLHSASQLKQFTPQSTSESSFYWVKCWYNHTKIIRISCKMYQMNDWYLLYHFTSLKIMTKSNF
jgi:hypothetical protein